MSRPCYNPAIIFLMLLILKQTFSCGMHKMDSEEFNTLPFKEKLDYLKQAFEKAVYITALSLEGILPKYEGVDLSSLAPELRQQIVGCRQAYTIANAVKLAVDKAEGNGGQVINFKCFLHEDNTPSMNYMVSKKGFHCFGCSGENGAIIDIFNLLSLMEEWQGRPPLKFADQVRKANRLFVSGFESEHLFADGDKPLYHKDFIPYTKEMNRVRHNPYLNFIDIKKDENALAYLESRGIDEQTAYRLGVMTQYPTDSDGNSYGRGYLVFINSDGTYVRRLFLSNPELSAKCPYPELKWWNKKGANVGIFNGQVIEHCQQYNQVCFVCEGAIDAMSIECIGYHAIALNSVNNAENFVYPIDERNRVKYICLADNDNGGRDMARTFLKKGNLFVSKHALEPDGSIFTQYKDVNEIMVADGNGLAKALYELEKQANEFYGF